MTYENKDRSIDDGAPVNLYRIVADNFTYYYTDCPRPVPVTVDTGAQLFLPRQIDRTDITYTASMDDDSECSIRLPENDTLSALVSGIITPQDMHVTIWEVHLTDADAQPRQIYFGKVVSISTEERVTSLSAVSIMQTHMDSEIPNVTYSRTCNHKFGSAHCGFNLEQVAHTGLTVVAFGVWDLTLSGAVPDENKFVGGTVVNLRTGYTQDIAALDGVSLLTLGGFMDIAVGDALTLYQSCAHTASACAAYNNSINFGGFSYMPRKNPFVQGFGELVYYPESEGPPA